MTVTFDQRLRVPGDVLISDLDGETVMLNLKSEAYFGLDKIGSRMLGAVTAADSIDEAFTTLSSEFDVDPAQLREDLAEILDVLVEHGLLEAE
jgi:hypothetical protein